MADGAIVSTKKHWAAARADALIGQLEKAPSAAIEPYTARAGHAVLHLGVAATVAVALGAADAAFGPEPGGFSTDGALAVGALLLSVATAGTTSDVALTQGVMLSGMFLRRKTAELMKAEAPITTTSTPSSPKEDPIVAFDKSRKT